LIEIHCRCGKVLGVSESKIGLIVKCPACNSLHKITSAGGEPVIAQETGADGFESAENAGDSGNLQNIAAPQSADSSPSTGDLQPGPRESRCPSCGLIGDFIDACPSCGARIGGSGGSSPYSDAKSPNAPASVIVYTLGSCLSVFCCPLLAVLIASIGLRSNRSDYDRSPKIYRQLTILALVVGIVAIVLNVLYGIARLVGGR